MDEQSDTFSQLFVKTMDLALRKSDDEVEAVLDKLLQLNYGKRIYAITNQIAGEVLCHIVTSTRILKSGNERLLNKYFQLIMRITSSQELTLERDAVNTLLEKLQEVWEPCMKSTLSLQGLLDALSTIAYQNGPNIMEENMDFLLTVPDRSLPAIVNNESLDIEVRRTSIQCIAGLCSVNENGGQLSEKWMELCLNVFLSVLQDQTVNPAQDVTTCKIIFSAAKGLHNILSSSSSIHIGRIGPLLTVLKKFMFYGLPGLSNPALDELRPVQVPDVFPGKHNEQEKQGDAQQTEMNAKSREKKKKRKSKPRNKRRGDGTTGSENTMGLESRQLGTGQSAGFRGHMGQQKTMQFRPAWARVTSSESEYSDTEGAQKARLRSFLSKIRQISLSVLYLTVKRTPKRTILGYWSSFLPDSPSLSTNSSLFTSFRQDPVPKCRAAALGVVGAMLDGSRGFLSLAAEETGSPSQYQASSFVPFSATLAASIREIHKQLLSASSKEQSTLALTQLLKSISILVSNTPYHKMKPGLLVQLASQARYFLTNSRDVNVRVACLAALGSIASTSEPMGEVANIITDTGSLPMSGTSSPFSGSRSPTDQATGGRPEYSPDVTPWFIRNCMDLAMPLSGRRQSQQSGGDVPEVPHPLRVEALQTLARTVKGYLATIRNYIGSFADLICKCLEDSSLPVRLHSCKLLEELGSSLLQLQKTSSSKELEEEMVSIWTKFLSGPLQGVIQDHGSSNLQSKACDSLSTIGPVTFQALPQNLQILCITLLLGFASDENAYVRSTSVRALGVYVMFPHLREDIAFLEDVAGVVLRLLDDSFLNVRANAAWSLGNLTDTIIINKEMKPAFEEEFQSSFLLQLFNSGIKAMEDKDKVRFNMMRVLGNLLRFAEKKHSEDKRFRPVMLKATEVLAQMVAGNAMVKVRWNACIACSNFLRNDNLPLGEADWTDQMYKALCESVTSCKNFKVRIKAALALSTPAQRLHYGSLFGDVFSCLVHGLEDSDTTADFTEFKFKDTLQEQLCATLVHLVLLMEKSDLPASSSSLGSNAEEIKEQLAAYQRKIQHAAEVEGTANTRLNSSSGSEALVTGTVNTSLNSSHADISKGGMIPGMVEEYIVFKQLTAQEKLENLEKAVIHLKSLLVADANDNSVSPSLGGKQALSQQSSNLLREIFSFENISA